MKKKITKFALFLILVTSCEQVRNESFHPLLDEEKDMVVYANGQGLDKVATFQNMEMIITEATPSSYNLRLQQAIHIATDGVTIGEIGFKVVSPYVDKGTEILGKISRSGTELVAEATLPCNYDAYYSITPLMTIGQHKFYGKQQSFSRTLEDMKPKADKMATSVEMVVNAHTISPVLETAEMVDYVEFTFAGTTCRGVKSGNRFSADFDLNSLEASKNVGITYSGIKYIAANQFGQASGTIDYSVRMVEVEDYVKGLIETADGPKPDYITIGGVNWSRGNLIYKNGNWGIDDNPFSHPVTQQDKNLVQYFSFGSTAADPDLYHNLNSVDNVPSDFSGDTRYDVVAANLPGWRIPTYNEALDFDLLTSKQNCEHGIVVYPVKDAQKYFYSHTPVRLKSVPSDGLYLPCGGVYSGQTKSSGTVSNLSFPQLGAYMTDSKFDVFDLLGIRYRTCYCIYFYNPNSENSTMMSYWYIFDATYRGYGSYDMGKKEYFSPLYKYFVRPVYGPK